MTNLLQKILNVLPSSQQAAINLILEKRRQAGELTSLRSKQEEAIQIYNRIKAKFGGSVLSPRYIKEGSKISSVSINHDMEEIYIDLSSLYSSINQLSKASAQQAISLDSDYQKSRAAVQKLITDATVFALRKKYPDFNEVKVVDFNSATNESKKTPRAEVNPKTRLLELMPLDSSRAQLENRVARTTSIYTKTISPGIKGTISKSFPPELMVDQKPETFWANLVMSDSPIYQRYERKTRSGSAYQVDVNGPVTEVYFRFSHMERLNNIRILPFADFPVRILDIAYRPSASSAVFYAIDDFSEVSTLDWEELNFAPIFAHEVKITIAQENYKQAIYQLPQSVVSNTDIFQKIFDAKVAKIAGATVPDSDATIEFLRTVDSYQTAIGALDELLRVSGLSVGLQTPIDYYERFTDILSQIYSDLDKQMVLTNLGAGDPNPLEKMLEIRKFEYLLGIREVEMGYTIYAPTCTYESEQYLSQATISQLQIEVDDRHTAFQTSWETGYRKTSVEWSIDLGKGRVLPIHPRNQIHDVDGIQYVKDERLFFDLYSGVAQTRLGSAYNTLYMLKKDGERIPESMYSVARQTGNLPQLHIALSGEWFDPNGVYTVDYAVDNTSYNIDILSNFNSITVEPAELFKELGPDNDITLSKFPYINYEVINLTGHFAYQTGNASWIFTPAQPNINSGQLQIDPTITDTYGNILHTGSTMVYGITGLYGLQSGVAAPPFVGNTQLSNSYLGNIDGINYGYFIQVMDSKQLYEVSGFVSTTGIRMIEPISVTLNQLINWNSTSGAVVSGFIETTGSNGGYMCSDYVLGIGIKTDDQIFALTESTYTPITVKVGGRDAKNITDYVALQHPAFSIPSTRDKNYEYIQAGKKIYFNQPIQKQDIKVVYNWITDYVKLIGILRCNTKINPDMTPKVNAVRILINNLVI